MPPRRGAASPPAANVGAAMAIDSAATAPRAPRLTCILVLVVLPPLELVEKLALLLGGQRSAAGGLGALIKEFDEDFAHVLLVHLRRRCHDIALEPEVGRGEAPPPGEIGRDVDLMPFRMPRHFLQARQ